MEKPKYLTNNVKLSAPKRGPFTSFHPSIDWPSVEVYETNYRIVVQVEIPGISSDDIDITINDGKLLIYVSSEKLIFKVFRRELEFKIPLYEENCKAEYKDGILTIILPKKQSITIHSDEDVILTSLDGIYRAGLPTDEIVLPGIIDILLSEDPDREKLELYLDQAPEYFSKQIYELCAQSMEFHEVIQKHFESIGTIYKVRKSFFDPMILRLRGFVEQKPAIGRIGLPIMAFNFPADECSVDSEFEHTSSSEGAFKIDIPGFAGGKGKRKKAMLATTASKIRENFQGHVNVDIKLRKFKKIDEILILIEIINISPLAYPVGESDSRYYALGEPNEKIYQATLGAALTKAEETNSIIYIERGYWAKFGITLSPQNLTLLSAGTLTDYLAGLKLGLSLKSESLASFKFSFKSPVGVLYELIGANRNSLHLFVEKEK